MNLSNVYQSSGKTTLAIELLESTLKTEKLSNVQKGILLNNLGNSYILSSAGNLMHPEIYQKAENTFDSAVHYLKNEKEQSETLSNSYRNLTTLNRQRQQFEVADCTYQKQKSCFFKLKTNSHEK